MSGRPTRTCPRCGGDHTGNVCPQVAASPTVPLGASGGASLPKPEADHEPETTHDLQPDDPVGEYRVVGILGRGGFGVVYEAIQPVIGKRVAIKVLNLRYSSDPVFVARFTAEARAVNQIRHRHIIDIFSFGQLADGRQYYVMELLHGQTLSKYMNAHGRLSGAQALPILQAIARALDAAHGQQIAHRDLKPDNVFITNLDDDGKPFPKLLDFGIAKLLARSQVERAQPTITGGLVGTPPYMSPEQCKGEKVDHRTDVYSLGVIAYDMLAGRLPFDGKSDVEVMWKHIAEPPPAPSTVAAVARSLDAPILAMLEKEPDKRPDSAGEAIRRLAEAIERGAGSTPEAPAAAPPTRASREETAPTLAGDQTLSARLSAVQPAAAPAAARRWTAPLAIALLAAAAVTAGVLLRNRDGGGGTRGSGGERARADVAGTGAGGGARGTAAVDAGMAARTAPADAAPAAIAPPDPGPTVVFDIAGTPPGTRVSLDGKLLGEAPGPIVVPAGKDPIELTFTRAGYTTVKRTVTPSAGDTLTVKLHKSKTSKPPSEIPPW